MPIKDTNIFLNKFKRRREWSGWVGKQKLIVR